MARPKSPDSELHERSFRVRLKDADANLLYAIGRKLDVPPAVLLRNMVVKQLPTYAAVREMAMKVRETQPMSIRAPERRKGLVMPDLEIELGETELELLGTKNPKEAEKALELLAECAISELAEMALLPVPPEKRQ
jgi:hypothetical protein